MALTSVLLVTATGAAPPVANPRVGATIAAAASHPAREVFGFALASSLGDATVGYPSWNFDLLTTVAFFGLHVNTAGQFANDSGWTTWNSSALTNLVSVAHQHGTKVVLTIVLQDFSPNTPNMCAGLAHADATVTQTVAEVKAKGVDGVNIDYEGLDGPCGTSDGYWARHAMTGLAAKLRAALGTTHYLSVDTYASSASDAAGFFDVGGLAPYVDSFFVMAYDLEYSNYARAPVSCARMCLGPTSPLSGYYYNDSTVASQYVAVVPATKVLLGVPYYGRKACVGSAVANAYPTSAIVADSYLNAAGEATDAAVKAGSYAVHRDSHSSGSERWDTWYNTTLSCTRELYWDDATSLGKKYDLVNAAKLRGVGIWNLNYGGGATELWTALSNHFVACTSAGISASPASPQVGGAAIQVTASASGCDNPQFEFWVQAPGSTVWQLAQAYSASATLAWSTAGKPTGQYRLAVWARSTGGAGMNATTLGRYDSYAAATYDLLSKPCAGVTAAASPAPPLAAGTSTTVGVTGGVSGCPNPLYEFWIQPAGATTWTLVQAYSPNRTYSWNTTGAGAGTLRFGVWAKDAGSKAAYDSYASLPYEVTAPCSHASVSFSPSSPVAQGSGTVVTVSAASSGCPSPLYEFWMRPASSSTWQVVQPYSSSATYSWNTAGAPAGAVYFGVWARDAGSSRQFDTNVSSAFAIVAPCTSVKESFSPAPPVAHGSGAVVTVTGTAAGCPQPLYEFWIKPSGSAAWQLVQPYSTTATYAWNTKGAPAGTVTVGVWARDASSGASYDAVVSAPFTLT